MWFYFVCGFGLVGFGTYCDGLFGVCMVGFCLGVMWCVVLFYSRGVLGRYGVIPISRCRGFDLGFVGL